MRTIKFHKTECGVDFLLNVLLSEEVGKSYLAKDVYNTDSFEINLKTLRPDVVVLNTGFAQVDGFGALIMGKDDVSRVHKVLPNALIIAVHMEAIDHCVLTRKELADYVKTQGISGKVIIPADGQVIKL